MWSGVLDCMKVWAESCICDEAVIKCISSREYTITAINKQDINKYIYSIYGLHFTPRASRSDLAGILKGAVVISRSFLPAASVSSITFNDALPLLHSHNCKLCNNELI